MIEEFPLVSSWLAGGRYDDETQELTLTTNEGGEYTFEGVPPAVAQGLKTARSPGQFYAQHLRGKY